MGRKRIRRISLSLWVFLVGWLVIAVEEGLKERTN